MSRGRAKNRAPKPSNTAISNLGNFDVEKLSSVHVIDDRRSGVLPGAKLKFYFPRPGYDGRLLIEAPSFGQLHAAKTDVQVAEDSLLELARAAREITNGVVNIHPAYGAVFSGARHVLLPRLSERVIPNKERMLTIIDLPDTDVGREALKSCNFEDAKHNNLGEAWQNAFDQIHPNFGNATTAAQVSPEMIQNVTRELAERELFMAIGASVHFLTEFENR